MAVQYVQGGGGLLGGLGAIATIGGALTGNPFLTKLGMGAGLVNSMMNGTYGSSAGSSGGSLLDIMSEIFGDSWQNPASNGKPKTDAEIYKSWSPYDPNAGRSYF